MLASTQSSSLVSQEIYTSNTTTSASSSNSTTNGESSVNSSNNLSECLTASSTTPPSYFLLYYWTILYTYITNIFSKSTARLRRHSTGEHAYMAQVSVSPDTNNNINNNTNNNNSPQQPLRRSPRFKSKKPLQQQVPSSSIDIISPLKATNSSIRLRNNARQVHLSSMTSTPSFSSMMKTKTLILDLDETLIHSTSRGSRADAHMIEVMVDNHACLYYVYKRPHVDHFLKKVSEWYKVVIFTASMPEYADPVIDWLDPNKNLICNRFFRQSCTNRNGAYIKDLTIVEPDLSKVCLVDNSPISYAINQENGIAIEGWINDPHDEALLDLLPFLDALRFTEDVRSILSLATY